MTDSGPRPEESHASPAPADEEKLDLASVAEQLAAKSRELEGDLAVEPAAPAEETPAEPEPEPEPDLTVGARELSGAEVYAAVEALLFAADKPITAAQLARALPGGVGASEVRKQLAGIAEELADGERGFELREIAGGWQLLTRERFAPYVAKLKKAAGARKLSGSALETLAVVAYKQPVMRAEVERIRGVACGDMLRNLMEKRLVRITGRSPDLGAPLLYGTTSDFLDHFGLASLSDLPRSAELGRKPKPSEPAVTPPAEGGGEGEGDGEAPAESDAAEDEPEAPEA